MPVKRTTPTIAQRARELRHETTDAENMLWARLRGRRIGEYHFRRQHAIGNFIVDFCSINQKLIIELDGSQHLNQEKEDEQRTRFLEEKGYRVLRFWNDNVIRQIDIVLDVIISALEDER